MTLRVINFADGFTSENVPVADAIQAHIDNPTDAHDASAISYDNTDSELVADDVQAAIDEVELRLDTAETNISNHINNATDAHDASAVSYDNTDSELSAVNVQDAIDEVELRLATAEADTQAIEDSIGQANGIAPLNGSSKIDATYLPSYVDDVLEYADIASLPLVGEQGKIYVTIDTNKTYRWTGSVYVEISASPVTSVNSQTGVVTLDADDIAETATRYWSKKNNVANIMPLVTNDASENYSVGSQWYDAINDTLYICEDATIGAAVWQPISGAGGGVGSVDIMFADTFENTDIADYTITQPLASISAVSPLQGENSLLIAHDFNPDYYIERIIPVDNKFKNKNVTFTLDVFTNAASGDLTLSVWDHTNTVQLLNSELIQPQDVDQTSAKRSFSFNIPSGANELRYRINVLFDSGKVSRVDNLVIELTQMSKLDTTIETPIITEWVDAGPITISATTTAPTKGTTAVDKVKWRQVGEEYEVEYRYRQTTAGAAGSGDYIFQLPAGIEFDDLIPSYTTITRMDFNSQANTAIIDASGMTSGNDNGGGDITGIMKYSSNSFRVVTKVSFSSAGNISSTYNQLSNNPQSYSFNMKFKGKGLQATETQSVSLAQTVLVQESDSALDLYGGAFGSTNTRVVRFASISKNIGDAITYVPSLTLGDSFVINKSGIYDLSFSAKISAAVQIGITKNLVATGAVVTGDNLLTNTETGGVNFEGNCSTSAYLEVGDIIRCHVGTGTFQSSTDKRACNFQITYNGSLKQLNVSENQKIEIPTSELRMEGASARGTGAETFTAKYTNIAKIRGDAFSLDNSNATIVTMKKKGRLNVSASIRTNTSAASITKNQAVNTAAPLASERMAAALVTTATAGIMSMHACFDVNIGDVIRVNAEATPTADSGNSLTLSFQEQEVAVSVTNVLPQFSESDSSVRLNTANGYGSTNTRIRRFSNVVENTGSSVTYADSSTLGSSFTINEDAIYNISYTDNISGGVRGISLNSNLLTTNVENLPVAQVLACSAGASIENVSWQGRLQVGDVIRPHTDGSANAGFCIFTISKVGKPNVTGVDVTPFAKIEYEVKQFIEQIAVSSVWVSNIARFQNLNLNTNNGLIRYTDDGTNGTRFTALKPCEVSVSVNGQTTSTSAVFIRRNGVSIGTGYGNTGIASDISTTSIVKLNIGDYIDIFRDTSASVSVRFLNITATELRDAYQVIGGGVENTYSARIANNGTATLVSQSYPFIDSISRTTTGTIQINFKAGFFTVAPTLTASALFVASDRYALVDSVTTTTAIVKTFQTSSGTSLFDVDFFINLQRQGSDYRTPSKAIGLPAQRVAVIKDVKANNTAGGSASTTYTARVLNTLQDPTGMVANASSFTGTGGTNSSLILGAGKYKLVAKAPTFGTSDAGTNLGGRSRIRLYNVTDASTIAIGQFTQPAGGQSGNIAAMDNAELDCYFTLTSQKTLEIQHRFVTTTASSLGTPANFGEDEVYTVVTIEKIEE